MMISVVSHDNYGYKPFQLNYFYTIFFLLIYVWFLDNIKKKIFKKIIFFIFGFNIKKYKRKSNIIKIN